MATSLSPVVSDPTELHSRLMEFSIDPLNTAKGPTISEETAKMIQEIWNRALATDLRGVHLVEGSSLTLLQSREEMILCCPIAILPDGTEKVAYRTLVIKKDELGTKIELQAMLQLKTPCAGSLRDMGYEIAMSSALVERGCRYIATPPTKITPSIYTSPLGLSDFFNVVETLQKNDNANLTQFRILLTFLFQLANSIKEVHDQGLIASDVKAENFIVMQKGDRVVAQMIDTAHIRSKSKIEENERLKNEFCVAYSMQLEKDETLKTLDADCSLHFATRAEYRKVCETGSVEENSETVDLLEAIDAFFEETSYPQSSFTKLHAAPELYPDTYLSENSSIDVASLPTGTFSEKSDIYNFGKIFYNTCLCSQTLIDLISSSNLGRSVMKFYHEMCALKPEDRPDIKTVIGTIYALLLRVRCLEKKECDGVK